MGQRHRLHLGWSRNLESHMAYDACYDGGCLFPDGPFRKFPVMIRRDPLTRACQKDGSARGDMDELVVIDQTATFCRRHGLWMSNVLNANVLQRSELIVNARSIYEHELHRVIEELGYKPRCAHGNVFGSVITEPVFTEPAPDWVCRTLHDVDIRSILGVMNTE